MDEGYLPTQRGFDRYFGAPSREVITAHPCVSNIFSTANHSGNTQGCVRMTLLVLPGVPHGLGACPCAACFAPDTPCAIGCSPTWVSPGR